MRYFFIFLVSIASLTSMIAMEPNNEHEAQKEESRLRRNPNLIANLLEKLQKKEEETSAQQQREAQAERAAEILQKAETDFALKIIALKTKLRQYHLLQNISDDLGSVYSGCGWENHRVSVLSVASVASDTARITKKALINRRMQETLEAQAVNYDDREVVKACTHHEIAITNEKLLEVYDRAYKTL